MADDFANFIGKENTADHQDVSAPSSSNCDSLATQQCQPFQQQPLATLNAGLNTVLHSAPAGFPNNHLSWSTNVTQITKPPYSFHSEHCEQL